MKKSELVSKIALDADITKAKAEAALASMLSAITESLKDGEAVTLTGFGTFDVKHRAARVGRNPSSGEPVQIAAAVVPGFKPGKFLKDAVN